MFAAVVYIVYTIMLSYFDLRKGIQFILEGQPYEVLEFHQMGKAQDVVVAKTKIKNLITGKVFSRNFHQNETFEQAEIQKMQAKFIYAHRGKFVFSRIADASSRFELQEAQLGDGVKFLKPNLEITILSFNEQIINVTLPIKVELKVVDAPPNLRGNTAQGGTKPVTVESGATVNAPLFVETGDILEVNTETGEYVRRIQ